ncbi:helix-turn-helix transcriptional regulator [Svornostia abyssi]|uniref:Helix-turn-helix transcriptional regulator n=1 Tax=Svornostia abyssi TaxID=2898438 RepID=A0ABY5PJR6_9ACTN|nr:helix-turn-helix transcriptional regulator [Parviterribacteraceae bacterium J379]
MEGYRDYCPLSRAAEIFATRWTPLIVRNLLLGCETFSELREGAPGISRTLLTQRLRLLEHHGVVERRETDGGRVVYGLTESGYELAPVCAALGTWGETWIELSPEHFDATKVMWGAEPQARPHHAARRADRRALRRHRARAGELLAPAGGPARRGVPPPADRPR